MSRIGVPAHVRTLELFVIADLDTLLTALYVELTGPIIPSRGLARSGPGRPPEVTDAEVACLAVAQVLLRFDGERHWLRQRVEAIIWTLKSQLGLERHGGRGPRRPVGPRGPAAPRAQRRHLAQLGHRRAPVKRSLIADAYH